MPGANYLTLNTIPYQSLDNAFSGPNLIDGLFWALDPFGQPPRSSAPEYDETAVTYPGVSGVALKRLGFRGRNIRCIMVAIGTKSAMGAAIETFRNGLVQLARYSIIMPEGTTFPGCKLVKGSCEMTNWSTLGNKTVVALLCDFRQYSESN